MWSILFWIYTNNLEPKYRKNKWLKGHFRHHPLGFRPTTVSLMHSFLFWLWSPSDGKSKSQYILPSYYYIPYHPPLVPTSYISTPLFCHHSTGAHIGWDLPVKFNIRYYNTCIFNYNDIVNYSYYHWNFQYQLIVFAIDVFILTLITSRHYCHKIIIVFHHIL